MDMHKHHGLTDNLLLGRYVVEKCNLRRIHLQARGGKEDYWAPMRLCSLTCYERSVSQRASKTVTQLLFRALNTYNLLIDSDRDHDCPSNQIDLGIVAHLQQSQSLSNPYFLNKMVSFCAKTSSFDVGIQVHSVVVKMGFTANVYICSAMVDMYAKCGEISSAQKLSDEMPQRNVVTWNSLISGYLNVNCPKITVQLFVKMLRTLKAVTPFSISGCLVACSQLHDGELGAQVHGLSLKIGFGYNVVVGTDLISMYSKCCNVDDARRVFDNMVDKNVITWTSMVSGYAQNEQADEVMILVREMKRLGVGLNYVTYNSMLSSFCGPDHLDCCRQVHCCIIRQGLESNMYISVTLVDVYSKCSNSLEDFEKVCLGVNKSDQISWNVIIAGYSNLGHGEEAVKCFCAMRRAGIDVDLYTFTSVLGAIGNIPALEEGKEIHGLILKTWHAPEVYIQNGLVSMYARCGAINDSKRVFWLMEEHDVISWNALLTGCAHHGYGQEAIELFEQMRKMDIKPDSTTFLAMLSACSHVGFLDKGVEYFNLMRSSVPLEHLKADHYACVVDIFGRAGYLNEAEAFINSMLIQPGPSVYKALLSACLVHGNKEVAARSAIKLLQLWPDDSSTYVLLSNVLMTEGYWDDAADIKKLMRDRGVKKKVGYSWISDTKGVITSLKH